MKFWVAIPTYWTYPGAQGQEEVIFGHPTPLDTPGTLRRCLESLIPLVTENVQVGVVAAAAASALERDAEARVQEVIRDAQLPYSVIFFSASHLKSLRQFFQDQGKTEWNSFLCLTGYAQIRNITLVLANICESDILVSLDDDEIFRDSKFFAKIEEDFALLGRDYPVFGLAGVYLQADGSIPLPEPQAPWTGYWPKIRWLNAALTKLVESGARLKPTCLGFGGNLALSSQLFRRLPFDPAITRGEDVDYIINARMFAIPFFLDNTLSIIHLPPETHHPTWVWLRQDLLRFTYTRLKLLQQQPQPEMVPVHPEELKPYPGNFLEDDLETMALQSHTLLALEYLAGGDPQAARHTLENLALMHGLINSGRNFFLEYLQCVSKWRALQTWLAVPEVAARAKRAIWGQH